MNYFRNIKTKVAVLLMALTMPLAIAAVIPATVHADDFKGELCGGADLKLSSGSCENCKKRDAAGKCTESENAEDKVNSIIKTIVNILTTIVGILAVIFIIIGGFKYITSGGDSGKITSAKNTIVYAIVGLIIVALAQVIVRFVLNKATS